jgi:hypothetical protein
MKRLLVYFAVISLVCSLTLVACSKDDGSENEAESTEIKSEPTKRKSLKEPIDKARAVRAMEEERARSSDESQREQ